MFCEYKHLFGKPNKGFHKYRIFNIAIIDFLLTFVLIYFLKKQFPQTNYFYITVFVLFMSLFIHHIFCVKTTLTKIFL